MVAAASFLVAAAAGAAGPDRCVVPAELRAALLDEISGERALDHVQILAVNRDRQPQEYLETFFETTYIKERLQEYGLSDVRVDYFPAGDVWDAEDGDLWLTSPARRKLAGLALVPAALARGSAPGEVEAEVVYVGPGRDADFVGKDVTGKIVLGNASVTQIFNAAVTRRGAAGALGTGSAGVSADSPGYSLDQIGWQTVSPQGGTAGFGWVLSLRQFNELRDLLERGKVVVRSQVRTRTYPNKLNVTSAAIPGSQPDAGELLFVAHAFETVATPGANDNCSGVATTLEIARALSRAIKRGSLPQPRRTIRFIWVPEISGSRAYMSKNPGLQDRLLAVLNFDMTGPDLEETDTYLRMKMTPDSRPSYLNDLVASLLQFVDQTDIRTQTGNNAPFNYRLVPYIGNSDHAVFLDAGIPAMQFNHWADNFYHSSEDRAEHADPTQLKRVAFMGAAAFAYLASAGSDEARALAWEAAANGEKWIAEVTRQSVRLMDVGGAPAEASRIHERYGAAYTKVTGAFNRARGGVQSVLTIARDPALTEAVQQLVSGLEASRDLQLRKLEGAYRERCRSLGLQPSPAVRSTADAELATLIPRWLFTSYSDDFRRRTEQLPKLLANAPRLSSLAGSEVLNFIDGRRTILEIYQGVRAEYGNVTTSSNEFKFAYVVTPDTPDVPQEAVLAYIRAMETAGLVEITKKRP